MDGGDDFLGARVRLADLDADGALRGRRQHVLDGDQLGDAIRKAEPAQSRRGEQRRLSFALFELAQPRLHVAAEQHRFQVGPLVADEGFAPDRRGADNRRLAGRPQATSPSAK